MADQNIVSSIEWRKVSRKHRTANFSPTITLRRGGILAISADFMRMADIASCTRASLFLSSDGMRLAIYFHSNAKDEDAYIVGRDGGGRGSGKNRVICAHAVFAQSETMRRLLGQSSSSSRRFLPVKIDGNRWMINLAPCFENRVHSPCDLPDNETGIYRYVRGEEVTYIGKGSIKQRCSSPDRREWQFDHIEYSRLNDSDAEAKWELFWLNEHRRQHGRWPFHNRIGGLAIDQG